MASRIQLRDQNFAPPNRIDGKMHGSFDINGKACEITHVVPFSRCYDGSRIGMKAEFKTSSDSVFAQSCRHKDPPELPSHRSNSHGLGGSLDGERGVESCPDFFVSRDLSSCKHSFVLALMSVHRGRDVERLSFYIVDSGICLHLDGLKTS